MVINDDFKGFDALKRLIKENPDFGNIIQEGIENGQIRYFGDEEWDKMEEQNFVPHGEIKKFSDIFKLGYNEGGCTYVSKQLSFSYDDVDWVSGLLPILKGTRNCAEGEHSWLETRDKIIDTSLVLVIDKELKSKLGYQTEVRYTPSLLNSDRNYLARKDFTNDPGLKSTPTSK